MSYTVEQARTLRKISQRKMAELLNINENTYINKEKGLSRFYIDEALKFCDIVNLDLGNINFFTKSVPKK